MLGAFNGTSIDVKELLVDALARSTPARIQLSSEVFEDARKWLVTNPHRSGRINAIVGTWHTHPPGANFYSHTDESTLFRDKMRLDTDDPSLTLTPWAHLIFPGFAISSTAAICFTMQVSADYEREPLDFKERFEVIDACNQLKSTGNTIGVVTQGPFGITVERFHPDTFSTERRVIGFWKHFDIANASWEFQKVFLENFFRKSQLTPFIYVRSEPKWRFGGRRFSVEQIHRRYPNKGPSAIRFDRIEPQIR